MADVEMMAPPVSLNGGDQPAASKKKTIEKLYQKMSQLEHILLRPDTYIGSVDKSTELMWVYDKETDSVLQREITYVPGLYKIFDEILVNAADNKQNDEKMDTIKIDISPETNTISIYNNGKGIPIVIHKDEKMYVPTMIFGHLLTSSNYNDEEQKVTGGRNGYGAKLCNIYSTKFIVETASKQYKKHFKQTWGSNMGKASETKIKPNDKDDYTKITFCPDLPKFGMEVLDADIVALMSRRAFDVAASTGVKVYLNGKKLPVTKMKDYVNLYIKGKKHDDGSPLKVCFEAVSDRWQIACTVSDGTFQQVSFVNSIATTKGGKHVDYVADMIVKKVLEVLKKKNKGGIDIKPFQVKSHMWLFVNCLIVNPSFDSQTKESMNLQVKNFGSKCNISKEFVAQITKCGLVESVLSWAKLKARSELEKTSGKKQTKVKGIPKLVDANEAGSKKGHLCTLIITEGDSAKTLAVSGLSVVGRDYYGVFPLKGKVLNVREASHKQVKENAEINNLISILGLNYKKKYTEIDDIKTLRYGKLMIMADQDQDGSHIKGLVINFLHYNWPDLLKLPFLEEFITPIVKATKKNEEHSFYSLPEFEEWKQDTENNHTYNIKYYKGLGTSTSKEAKEYFQNMDRHRIRFKYSGAMDDQNIERAFSKKQADQRKEWLTNHMEETKRRKEIGLTERYLYAKDTQAVSFSDFINLELVLFSNGDNVRSIPSLMDGFKPGQRKVLYTCMKRNDKREVKVAQLAGSVAEMSAYHHGENSLCSTIVNLAQNYVGSNNINLLEPRGQFGTRLTGGKDSASPRYIFTIMSPLTRLIFHPHDDPLLTYEYDDNQRIEPTFYVPIIPMVLVNGAEGIGTGWCTKIPNFNPRELVANIRRMLDGDEPEIMHPWYKNFRGTVESCQDKYVTSGEISILPGGRVEISELPIGMWTQNYKESVLEPMLGTEKIKPIISDYKEYNTDTTIKFMVQPLAGKLAELESEGLHKAFKLQNTISMTTMNCFDENFCLKKYDKIEEILRTFFAYRMKMYSKRKEFLLGQLQADADKLTNQARFIVEKCDKDLVVENKQRKAMVEELIRRGYDPDPVQAWKKRIVKEQGVANDAEPAESDDEEEEEKPLKAGKAKPGKALDPDKAFQKLTEVKKFNYLLGMSMWMLTKEKKDELLKQRDHKLQELAILKAKTPSELWRNDLDVFIEKLEEVEAKEKMEEAQFIKKQAKAMGAKNKRQSMFDSAPSVDGRRVPPVITGDLLKRIVLAEKAKQKKDIKKEYDPNDPSGVSPVVEKKVRAPKVKKEKAEGAEGKEEKGEKAPRAPKGSKAAGGLKQSKLNFKKEGKAKGKSKKNSSDSDDDDMDIRSVGSGSSFMDTETVEPRERANARRAATKINNYSALLHSDKSSDSELEMFDNKVNGKSFQQGKMSSDDSDDDAGITKKNGDVEPMNTDNLFDSLIQDRSPPSSPVASRPPANPYTVQDSDDDDDDDDIPAPPKVTKPAAKVTKPAAAKVTKPAPTKRKLLPTNAAKRPTNSDSDSDEIFSKKPSSKAPKKSKKSYDSDSDAGELSSPPPPRATTGRSKKPTKFTFNDSDDSD